MTLRSAKGLANGVLIDIPGASPRLHSGGKGQPPVGYFLPPGDYTAQIGSSLDSTTYFALFLDNAAFSFHRQGAGRSDVEILRFVTGARSLSVINPDPGPKPLFLQSFETSSGEETVCRLHVKAMPPTDSLGIQLAGGRNVALLVGNGGMTADLRLELAKDYANPVFKYADLPLEGGASYLVAPVWDSLASIPLRIYLDRDRDGTVDDTLRLENQSTAIPPGRGEQIPHEFKLHQNYPNPFNPATNITYELPTPSEVQLSVYDILGREVRMLVNEKMNPGVHRVRFDASALASGMYIYRLLAHSSDPARAWTFVQSRKLPL